MDAPTIASLQTVAGAALLTAALMQFVILPVLSLAPATQERFGALIAIVVAIAIVEVATWTVVTGATRQDALQGAINGLFAGLSAIGIHGVTKATLAPRT